MITITDLPPDDQKRLDAMLEIFSRRAGCPITIGDLVERWTGFVLALQADCSFSPSDYEEGLRVRGMLEELGEPLSEPGRQQLLSALLESDRRFLSQTIPANGKLSRPWWRRYPPHPTHPQRGGGKPVSSTAQCGTEPLLQVR